jgi:hypothetical protein
MSVGNNEVPSSDLAKYSATLVLSFTSFNVAFPGIYVTHSRISG